MIRFVIVTAAETTVQAIVEGEIVDVIEPAGTILRSGYCSDHMFNLQAVRPNEMAIQVDGINWPVNDVTHRIDLSGDEPTIVQKAGDTPE